ncbi:MAG: phage regulatory protein/antirepressor Ant [Helicobacteraceae bacterium]|jgi:anti-repressor protein|nr:phage regulatory protein/antirepressor Ant [Helicobacteraceae bacterium]
MNKAVIVINNKSVTFGAIDDCVFITSRDIAAVFEKRHSDVIRGIEALPLDEYRQRNFASAEYIDDQGKPRKEYNITRDGFALLAMGFTGAKAYQWKVAFIDAFNKMEAELKKRGENAIPSNFAEALELAAKQARAIEANNALIAEQKAKIEADKPRVEFANRLLKSEGSLSLRDYAKVLCAKGFSIGEKRLFEKLRKIGILDRHNKPYQKYVESGIFSLKSSVYPNKSTGDSIIYTQTRITAKGQEHIYALIAPKDLFSEGKR